MNRFGLRLRRGKPPAPDFYFKHESITVFIEAIACSEPQPQNEVPLQSDFADDDFEGGGIAPEQIMQRLATVIDEKIAKVTRLKAQEAMAAFSQPGDYSPDVLAVNGRRAIQDWPQVEVFFPFIAQTVWGMPTEVIENPSRRHCWPLRKWIKPPLGKQFPIAHFDQPTWQVKDGNPETTRQADLTRIAGILYSTVGAWDTTVPVGDDFCFFQNPHGPDARQLFNFCRRGVWSREEVAANPGDQN